MIRSSGPSLSSLRRISPSWSLLTVAQSKTAAQSASTLAELKGRVRLADDGAPNPAAKGEVGMYLDGRWYTLRLAAPAGAADVGSTLDVSLLQEQVLTPLLDIGDPRTDKRIDFVGGARGTSALAEAVESGRAAVAFSMFPVGVEDLMSIADAGGIMPPKSTWFEPKLRDGLLVHLI